MGALHVVITISSSVETCVMGEERECGREVEEGRMKGQEEEGGIYTREGWRVIKGEREGQEERDKWEGGGGRGGEVEEGEGGREEGEVGQEKRERGREV